jgi:hypothetical protein
LKNEHWSLDLTEREPVKQISRNLIVGCSEPTTGKNLYQLRNSFVKINIEDAKRIAVVSKSGAGKTTLIGQILFFAKLSNQQSFIPFDMKVMSNGKSEYVSILEKLSEAYLHKNIFENEILSFMPYFLTNVSRPYGKEVFQFDLSDLSESEIAILLNITKASDFRKRNLLFNVIDKMPKDRKTMIELVDIFNDRMRLEALIGRGSDQTISSLMAQIASAIRYGTIGSRYKINFHYLINTGKIIDICFPRYDSFHESMTQGYVAVMEKIMKHCLEKRRRPVVTAIDEGRIVIPRSKSEGESSRNEIIKNIKTTRYLGETILFGVQDLKDVEESVVGQSGYYFISHRIQSKDIERMLSATSLPDEVKDKILHEFLPKVHYLARTQPSCKPWLMISEEEKSCLVYPLLGK